MTAYTRHVLLGGIIVVVLGLLVGFLAYLSGGVPAVAVAQERPPEFRYVPANASVVGFADLRKLMDSDLRELLRGLESESQFKNRLEFQERTSINIENDIDRVVAGLVPNGSDQAHGIIVLTGRFDVARLEALALENGGTASDYEGRRLIVLSREIGARAESDAEVTLELTMAFVEPGILALGSDVILRQVLDLPSDGDGVGGSEELMRLLSHIDAESTAWTIGRLDGRGVEGWIPDQMGSQILQMSAFAIGSQINGGISGTVMVETHDEAAGLNLHSLVQGFMALARMQSNSRPEVARLLDSFRLEAVGTNLTLFFDLSSDLLLQLIPNNSETGSSGSN